MAIRVFRTDEHVAGLREACAWMGITRGRASEYVRLLEESLRGASSEEHVLAAYESSEIVDLYDLWKPQARLFPGIRERLGEVGGKGAQFREGENASSSNRPRNDAFCLLVAGKLLAADIDVVAVDGTATGGEHCAQVGDVVVRSGGRLVVVECKRPRSSKRLERRVRDAWGQIQRGGVPGIIALDCSVLVRPAGGVLEGDALVAAERTVFERLAQTVAPRLYRHWRPQLLGFLLFARVPAMTRVDPDGVNGGAYRRDWTSSWVVVANRYAERPLLAVMARISRDLAQNGSGRASR